MRTSLRRRHRDVETGRDFGHRQALDVVQDGHGTIVVRQLLERRRQNAPKLGLHRRVGELCRPVNDRIRVTAVLVEAGEDLVE